VSRKNKSGHRRANAKAGENRATQKPSGKHSASENGDTNQKQTGKEIDLATINPQQFESGRQVAAAIAKKYDLAIVGGRLLSGSGDQKGASVSLRMFETTMEYLFGKPSSHPHQEENAPLRVIWDMPAPARELIEGDLP
jgi:hypothetical protein